MKFHDPVSVFTKHKQKGHVLHVTQEHSPRNPGVTAVVNALGLHLTRTEWSSTVAIAGLALTPVPEGVESVELPLLIKFDRMWRYSYQMKLYFESMKEHPGTVFHLHGVWGASQWLAARASVRHNMPSVFTAHDMLSPWHWRNGYLRRLKKFFYWSILGYPAFRHLTIIHALTVKEREYLAYFFPNQRLEVIPNAIDTEEVDKLLSELGPASFLPREQPYLLFLGRLSPQKGIDLLIKAFSMSVKGGDYRLLIAGPDSTESYTSELRSLVKLLDIEKQVVFLGPIFGPQKWQLYRDAWACCFPSRSEGMSITSLEAAAAGIPFITTYEAGILDWHEAGGILIHPCIDKLSLAIEKVFSWGEREKQDRGKAIRQLVERRYSWKAVGPLWAELYSELLEL